MVPVEEGSEAHDGRISGLYSAAETTGQVVPLEVALMASLAVGYFT